VKRADRGTSNSDNELNFPHPKQKEPSTDKELQRLIQHLRDDLKGVRYQLQLSKAEGNEMRSQADENYRLYLDEQEKYQTIFALYNQEQALSAQLLIQYQEENTLKLNYLAKYDELQTELKSERQSKARIKGWQTRRKNENERLKQQIGDIVILLRDSLERKEESIYHLYLIGDRMDRIQRLMDSVEQESNRDPVKLLEKLMRVWLLVQKILAE
jgi:phage regulator Rha-like protein